MTDTDKIRAAFEREITNPIYGLGSYPSDREISLMWEMFQLGIKQGQRDLIEAMDVVGYRYYVDKMDYWELVEDPVAHRICYPLYILPEDTTK